MVLLLLLLIIQRNEKGSHRFTRYPHTDHSFYRAAWNADAV